MVKPPRVPSGEVAREVWRVMRSDPNRLWTPARVAARLPHRSESTVSREMSRIVQKEHDGHAPPIERVERGLYRVFWDRRSLSVREDPPPKLHALQMILKLPVNKRWAPPGGAEAWATLRGVSPWHWSGKNGRWERAEQWRGRMVRFWLAPRTGTVSVSLAASEPKDNLDPGEFKEFTDWIGAWCQGLGVVWSDEYAQVRSFEMNKDYESLTLAGIRHERLRRWRNVWAQVYQKKRDLVRTEIRVEGDGRLSALEVHALLENFVSAPKVPDEPDDHQDPLGPEVA